MPVPGAQAASATGAARETAQEAVRRAEDNLQAARDKAAQTASSAYQATKGKAYETYEAGRDTAQQAAQAAVERAEAALQAARDKVGSALAACLPEIKFQAATTSSRTCDIAVILGEQCCFNAEQGGNVSMPVLQHQTEVFV